MNTQTHPDSNSLKKVTHPTHTDVTITHTHICTPLTFIPNLSLSPTHTSARADHDCIPNYRVSQPLVCTRQSTHHATHRLHTHPGRQSVSHYTQTAAPNCIGISSRQVGRNQQTITQKSADKLGRNQQTITVLGRHSQQQTSCGPSLSSKGVGRSFRVSCRGGGGGFGGWLGGATGFSRLCQETV